MITYCPRCGTQFRETALGESIEGSLRCADCAVTVSQAPLMLAPGNDEDEVEYDLSEWEMAERCAATTALLDVDIPYRWEADLVLVVPTVAEQEVDLLLDELEPLEDTDEDLEDTDEDDPDAEVDEDDEDDPEAEGDEDDLEAEGDEGDTADGGEEAQTAMGDLFVAADRLQHEPTDPRMAADAMEAATTVAACEPPYGIERPVWKQIQGLAEKLATSLEEAADEDTVADDARALREYLRDLV